MLEKNTRKHLPPDLRQKIRSCYAMRLVSKVSGASDFGQGRVNPSPITLSPGLTDHLDEYRAGLLRCSRLIEKSPLTRRSSATVFITRYGKIWNSIITMCCWPRIRSKSLLYRIHPNDAATLFAVSGVLAGVALLACGIPLLPATRIN